MTKKQETKPVEAMELRLHLPTLRLALRAAGMVVPTTGGDRMVTLYPTKGGMVGLMAESARTTLKVVLPFSRASREDRGVAVALASLEPLCGLGDAAVVEATSDGRGVVRAEGACGVEVRVPVLWREKIPGEIPADRAGLCWRALAEDVLGAFRDTEALTADRAGRFTLDRVCVRVDDASKAVAVMGSNGFAVLREAQRGPAVRSVGVGELHVDRIVGNVLWSLSGLWEDTQEKSNTVELRQDTVGSDLLTYGRAYVGGVEKRCVVEVEHAAPVGRMPKLDEAIMGGPPPVWIAKVERAALEKALRGARTLGKEPVRFAARPNALTFHSETDEGDLFRMDAAALVKGDDLLPEGRYDGVVNHDAAACVLRGIRGSVVTLVYRGVGQPLILQGDVIGVPLESDGAVMPMVYKPEERPAWHRQPPAPKED